MTIPTALVKVTLVEVDGLDLGALSAARAPFLVAHVGSCGLGRHPLLPVPSSQPVPIHAAAQPWECEMAVDSDAAIPVGVFLWDDRGDLAPSSVGTVNSSIPAGYSTQDYVLPSAAATPRARFRVQVTPVPTSTGTTALARGVPGQPAPAVLVVPSAAAVEITEVLGLYKPGAPMPSGLGRTQRQAEYLAGYRSEDNRGRIYLERDLNGNWARETQLIQLSAAVRLVGATLPPDAHIKWTVLDPDDPSNEARLDAAIGGGPATDARAPNVHEEWGPELDEGDYGPAAAGPLRPFQASRPNDNSGPVRATRFEAVTGYALTVGAASPPEAQTEIVGGISKVTVHCHGHAGDNLIVRAELTTADPMAMIPTTTGIMTLWQLIEVEYHRMPGADPLPVADVPAHFIPAFVQMEFTGPLPIPDRADFGTGDPGFRLPMRQFIENNFSHRNQGGWFFLLAAQLPYRSPTGTAGPSSASTCDLSGTVGADLTSTPALVGRQPPVIDYLDVTGDRRGTGSVTLRLSGGQALSFNTDRIEYAPSTNMSRIWLVPHDIQDRFEAGDGSIDNAHRFRGYHYLSGRLDHTNTWTPGGYGVSGTVRFDALTRGHYPGGTSPDLKVGRASYFAGRTVVFTHAHRGKSAPSVSMRGTIIHELTHAFGLPHKCGWWDYETPRLTTCCMNYPMHGLVERATGMLLATTPRPRGDNHCGKHLREIRRTVLSRNLGLGWR